MLYYTYTSTITERNTLKIDTLLKQDKKIFHTKDLELLWEITNKSTLHTTILRYIQRGILLPVYRGFYSTVPIEKIDPIELGTSAIHEYCYLSTESVLAKSGIIFQSIPHFTFCSLKNKKITINGQSFISRQLKSRFLFQSTGILEQPNYRQASPERAVADMLYFNPKYYFDLKDAIDWKRVTAIQKEVGYI